MRTAINRWLVMASVGVVALASLGAEPIPPTPAPAAVPSAEQIAAMEADFRAHMEKLGALAGDWTITRRGFTASDGAAVFQEGTFDISWALDRQYLQVDFDMWIKGRPEDRRVLWRGMFSYDPEQKTYVTTWLGTRGRRFTETGDWDASGKVLTLTSFQEDGATRKARRVVSVFTLKDGGSLRIEDTTFEEGGPAAGRQTLLLECVRR